VAGDDIMAPPASAPENDAKCDIAKCRCDFEQRRSKTLFALRQSRKIVSETSFSLIYERVGQVGRLQSV
jgi:hypothetical protein